MCSKSPLQSNPHHSRLGSRVTRRLAIVFLLAMSTALKQALTFTAEASAIEFDSDRKSPAIIQFDPEATVEGRGGYVSGNTSGDVPGPVVGTNVNTLVG